MFSCSRKGRIDCLKFLVILTLFVSHGFVYGQTASEWAPRALQSVASLKLQKKDGGIAIRTVFLALKDGIGVTTMTGLQDVEKAVVAFPNGEEYGATGIIDGDEGNDIALIRLRLFGKSLLSLKPAGVSKGARVFCIVQKEGDWGVMEARAGDETPMGNATGLVVEGTLPEGNGGAPVFDQEGVVVGVLIWKSSDGRGRYVLLPSQAVLAMDHSLPTRPWETGPVRDFAEKTAAVAPDPLETVDTLMAEAIIALENLRTFHDKVDVDSSGQGYLYGVPKELYSFQQKAEQALKRVAAAKIQDPARKDAAAAMLEIGAKYYAGVDEFIRAIVVGQQAKDWNAQANDLYKRSQASWETVSVLKESKIGVIVDLYNNAATFRSKVPKQFAYNFGILKRPNGLKLGIVSFPKNPFFIAALRNDSFAFRLGFRAYDRILSIGGRPLGAQDTIEDMTVLIMENLGRQLDAVVERDDKQKPLKLKIPSTIQDSYLRR